MSVDSVDPATRGVAGMHGRLGSMPIGRWHASAAPQSAWTVPTSCGRRRASETFGPHVTQMTEPLVQRALSDDVARSAFAARRSRSRPNKHTGYTRAYGGGLQRSRYRSGRFERASAIPGGGKGLKMVGPLSLRCPCTSPHGTRWQSNRQEPRTIHRYCRIRSDSHRC